MTRTVKTHIQQHQQGDEDDDDEEFVSRTPDASSQKVKGEGGRSGGGGKGGDQKVSATRSKHSETEQRRRSKINERFQTLRDLIPENDQKRDKASFLLEVIQYIQFLQDKLQMYEATYHQGWTSEPSKLIPWRNNSGTVDNFVDQSPGLRNGSSLDNNVVVTPSLLSNIQNSVESDLSGDSLFKALDNSPIAANHANPLDMQMQSNSFEGTSSQAFHGSFPEVELLASQSQSHFCLGKPSVASECPIPNYTASKQEELGTESGDSSISRAYSQGLLNSISRALQSSGVDLSQARISVQLDVAKRTNGEASPPTDQEYPFVVQPEANCELGSSGEHHDHSQKRLRREPS